VTTAIVVKSRCKAPQVGHVGPVRTRLLHLLDNISEPVTLLCGPQGAGKTVALASWAATLEDQHYWLSIGRRENSPDALWSAMLHTLRPLVDLSAQLTNIGLSDDGENLLSEAIPALLNALSCSTPLVLILDGVDAITDRLTRESLYFFAANLPAGVRLILSTASPAAGAAAVLRARGQLTDVDESDLKFTVSETHRLLRCITGRDFPVSVSARIHRMMDGWAAGTRLTALAINRLGLPAMDSGSLSRGLDDYLATEILDRLPVEAQQFLITTSVLHELTVDSCEALCGSYDTSQMLAYLASRSLLLRSDGMETRLRMHPVLQASLLARHNGGESTTVGLLHRGTTLGSGGCASGGEGWEIDQPTRRKSQISLHRDDSPRQRSGGLRPETEGILSHPPVLQLRPITQPTTPRSEALSSREHAVWRALSGPLTLREIANEMYLSHNTVKTHVRTVFRKLGVHSREEAKALRRSTHAFGDRQMGSSDLIGMVG
jgi:ATP/maltotriose-dependent transcriptional regulator MalT